MGEVIPLFGSTDDDNPFAEVEDEGEDAGGAPEPPDMRPRAEPPGAGLGPRAMPRVPADERQLDGILQNAQVAVQRLTSVSLPEDEMRALLAPYATIQENIAELRRRLQDPAQQSPDRGVDVGQDLANFQKDVQGWIESVELAISKAVGQGQVAAGLGRLGQANGATSTFPWIPVVVGVAAVGVVGYVVWQSQPRRRGPLPAR